MAIDVARVKAGVDLVKVVGSYVSLRKRGTELVGLCPFHSDGTNPNFYVVADKGFCHCFSCGWSGDAIDFIREIEGLDFKPAVERLSGTDWKPIPASTHLPIKPKPRWISIVPPADAEAPDMESRSLGPPAHTWMVRNAEGLALGYVARYEVSRDGETRKVILQYTYGQAGPDGAKGWACRHFNAPTPLYGLNLLAERPDAQVIVVEGEGKADAGNELLPQYLFVSWLGGAQAFRHANWSVLRGRDSAVVVVGDADDPGRTAMRGIAAILSGLGLRVKTVDPEPNRPNGWDIGDAKKDGWSGAQLLAWFRERAQEYVPAPPDDDPKQLPSEPANEPPQGAAETRRRSAKPALTVIDGGADSAAPTEPSEPDEALPPAFSEDHLAQVYAKRHGRDWRFVSEWGKWMVWNGQSWRDDRILGAFHNSRMICRDALQWESAGALTEAGKRSLASAKVHAAVQRIAQSSPEHAAVSDQWDADPWRLATPNGIVDLKTGELHPGRREDYFTKLTAVGPSGECPRWLECLDAWSQGDDELVSYLQRLVGYCLTGSVREEMLAFVYGPGGAGKSKFIDTIHALLGDYAHVAQMETFTEQRIDRHSTEIAAMVGKRLVIADETEEGKRWNEQRIKYLTGGSPIRARFMRQDEFEFKPQFKLLFSGNYKPNLRSVDEAIKRRVHIIPFTQSIPDEKKDRHLTEALKRELGGILRWAIDGCMQWQKHGLRAPSAVLAATSEYLETEDGFGQWMEECCRKVSSDDERTSKLFESWKMWSEKAGEPCGSRKRFSQTLQSRGFGVKSTMVGSVCVGLVLKM
jgi:putative DNA primase/helicase